MKEPTFPEFVWLWNRLQSLSTPRLHLEMANWLDGCWQKGERELLLLAFRDSGKSTIAGLFSAWLLAGNPNLRILVLAAEQELANKMVRNVKQIIEHHPVTRGLKPKRADQWAASRFTVNRHRQLRDPSMLGRGINANVTGSRADVVLCDDVEVPNTCDTVPKRMDLRMKLAEIDYVLVPGGLQLYIGTPHTYYSIYAKQARAEAEETRPFLDDFRRLELPLFDEAGKSRWPQRFSKQKIAAIERRSGPNKFASQMLLEEVNVAEARLDPDRLRLYEGELDYCESNKVASLTLEGKRLVSASCWWDPAFGAPERGDRNVVAALYTDENGEYWLHRVHYFTWDPDCKLDEATQLCREVVAFLKELHLPSLTLETNGLGRFLPGLLRRELAAVGLGTSVLEAVSTRAKDLRILDAFDAVLAAGALHAHRSVWASPFITEMRTWQPDLDAEDDGLDAVSGCLLAEPVRLPVTTAPVRRDWRGTQSVVAKTDFEI
ncbi:MAG: phage terminase large subunit [Alphaproteobacteria bacterium]|nr:phage terminase large subunit [Alphaproteobacteria bacterium]